jgi:hypothetical protein
MKSERDLAVEIVKVLNGVPIDKVRNALEHASGFSQALKSFRAKAPCSLPQIPQRRVIGVEHLSPDSVRYLATGMA